MFTVSYNARKEDNSVVRMVETFNDEDDAFGRYLEITEKDDYAKAELVERC